MGWLLRFVETEADSLPAGDDVIEVSERGPICDISHLGLTLAEARANAEGRVMVELANGPLEKIGKFTVEASK